MTAPDVIDLTRRLIAFETINPPGHEAEAAAFVADVLEQARFSVAQHSFAPGRVSLVARSKGGASDTPPLCLTGHLDTVPLGAGPWTVDPFAGEIIGDRLYGRGSSDMKSGVAAMICAAIKAGDLSGGPGVVMVITAGEETGCEGACHLASLDGALGEVGAIVVGEPTGNEPRVGHKGALWLLAETRGRTAHGSMPELGENAIYKAAKVIEKLQDFGFNVPPHPGLGSPSINVGHITGGMNVNSVPDFAQMGLDIRTVPSLTHAGLIAQLQQYLAPDLDQLRPTVDLGSVWTSPLDPWLASVASRLEVDWRSSNPTGVPFFTDASILKPALGDPPTLILGPGETAMAHQTDEYCLADRIPQAEAIYLAIIEDWQNQSHRA